MPPQDPSPTSSSSEAHASLLERIKELSFLHEAARLLNLRGEPSEVLGTVLQLLPGAWQYPEHAMCRIGWGELELTTPGYRATQCCIRSEFELGLEPPKRGFVEVCYAHEPPSTGAGPFLPEERALLGSCAELLKAYFERSDAEATRRALAETQAAEQAARAANRAKDDFLGSVAHELRASLHVMGGWVSILRQTPTDRAVAARGLDILERNVRLQSKLIEDLLDLARITSGKLQLDLSWLDLAELVNYAIDAKRPSAEAKQLRLERDVRPMGKVQADQQRLQQVVYNVLGNAVKFTPEGGVIEVRLHALGSHAELSIKDSGPGIAPELLPHIFERFKQAGAARDRRGGLGLGLAIAHHLVELHHGTITATSDGPGKGATFHIRLPLGSREGAPALE